MVFIIFFYDGSHGSKSAIESTGLCSQLARFDLGGPVTFMSATIFRPLLALSLGGTTYAWDNARIILLLILAGVLFCSFVVVEYCYKNNAIIPLYLLRRRSILAAI